MIDKWQHKDTPALLALWLESTLYGHPFIAEKYWRESETIVRDCYLPAAQTWVWREERQIKGFISVFAARFIGALFVAPNALRKGIGRGLLNHVRQRFSPLSLEVYQQNSRAVGFYRTQGFHIVARAWQEETQQATWIMSWQRG